MSSCHWPDRKGPCHNNNKYSRKDIENLALACGIQLTRSAPNKRYKTIRDLCAEITTVIESSARPNKVIVKSGRNINLVDCLADYDLGPFVAEGVFGSVYATTHRGMPAVVKFLPLDELPHPVTRARFSAEVENTRFLSAHGLGPDVYAAGTCRAQLGSRPIDVGFIIMERYSGSLRDYVKQAKEHNVSVDTVLHHLRHAVAMYSKLSSRLVALDMHHNDHHSGNILARWDPSFTIRQLVYSDADHLRTLPKIYDRKQWTEAETRHIAHSLAQDLTEVYGISGSRALAFLQP